MEKTRLELLIYCYQEKKIKIDFHKPDLIRMIYIIIFYAYIRVWRIER